MQQLFKNVHAVREEEATWSGSNVFIDYIYLALSDTLQLIRAGKPKQMPQS